MTLRSRILLAAGLALGGLTQLPAVASPITYTLETVADGKLGTLSFNQARLRIVFTSDTNNIQSTGTPRVNLVYTDHVGTATVSVIRGGTATTATVVPGQIYLRYDVTNGLVGFGSAISPTYPIVIGCGNDPLLKQCVLGTDWYLQSSDVGGSGWNIGTVDALADIADDPLDQVIYSAAVTALPDSLSLPSLLTGTATACAVPLLTNGPPTTVSFNPLVCPSAAPLGIKTSLGALFLQDDFSTRPQGAQEAGVLRSE